MEVKYLGKELSIGDHFFYCNSIKKNKVKELIAQWKNEIVEMQNGESAYIAVEWDTVADEVICLSTLKCLKAIKQEGKVRLLSVEAVDPFYDIHDEDCWLWTFSDLEARQLSWIWIVNFAWLNTAWRSLLSCQSIQALVKQWAPHNNSVVCQPYQAN